MSTNLLSNSDLKVIDCDGIKLLAMYVPRADRMERPVYTHNNPVTHIAETERAIISAVMTKLQP